MGYAEDQGGLGEWEGVGTGGRGPGPPPPPPHCRARGAWSSLGPRPYFSFLCLRSTQFAVLNLADLVKLMGGCHYFVSKLIQIARIYIIN